MFDLPSQLVERAHKGQVVLFVAAGCSIPSGLPNDSGLAARVADVIWTRLGSPPTLKLFNQFSFGSVEPRLDQVAQRLLDAFGSLDPFLQIVCNFSEWTTAKPTLIHHVLARLSREQCLCLV